MPPAVTHRQQPEDNRCDLCGQRLPASEARYKLPRKRTGSRPRLVCHACRWPDPSRQVTLEFIRQKAEHRALVGPTYTPNAMERDMILAAFAVVSVEDEDELDLIAAFVRAETRGLCPTLGPSRISILDRMLSRVSMD